MDKVIIYGMGGVFHGLRHELPKNIDIVAYADSRATSKKGLLFEGHNIICKEEILNYEYDYIYICTNANNAWNITLDLLTIGIDRSKIKYLYRSIYDGIWETEIDESENIVHHIDDFNILERKENKSDFQTISELFCTNPYGMDIPFKNTVVVDMGMNIGVASLIFAKNDNVKKVYSFEPFKDTFNAAIYNFSLNPNLAKKILPFNMAVYDHNEETYIRVLTEFAGGRTTEVHMIENNPERKEERKELIKYKSASEIMSEIIAKNEECHFVLKIDTEGAEFEIFKDFKKEKMFSYVDVIMMEYHRNPKELLKCLRSFGYFCIQQGSKNIGLIYAINMKNKD